jgi:hypothetical protein
LNVIKLMVRSGLLNQVLSNALSQLLELKMSLKFLLLLPLLLWSRTLTEILPTELFKYASVIGMLGYLQSKSSPDIAYAVNSTARFTHNPRRSHQEALKRIGWYLKSTINEGLVLRPTETLDIDCYVDADFSGLWPHEDKTDPSCVKSRTGFATCVANCPVIWSSKLQGSRIFRFFNGDAGSPSFLRTSSHSPTSPWN